MNIYLIQMTAKQSDNNSQKSEHETLQLRYSRENHLTYVFKREKTEGTGIVW